MASKKVKKIIPPYLTGTTHKLASSCGFVELKGCRFSSPKAILQMFWHDIKPRTYEELGKPLPDKHFKLELNLMRINHSAAHISQRPIIAMFTGMSYNYGSTLLSDECCGIPLKKYIEEHKLGTVTIVGTGENSTTHHPNTLYAWQIDWERFQAFAKKNFKNLDEDYGAGWEMVDPPAPEAAMSEAVEVSPAS